MADPTPTKPAPPPLAPGLFGNFRFDLLSGFLVFLIALPLCLGIAKASNFPVIAGIWTAVIGGMLTVTMSNSPLTIKGPAAGLIVIVEGAVIAFTTDFGGDPSKAEDLLAIGYPLTLGVGLAAGLIQVLFGLFKAGKLGELVPLTPVHGMLAAIGITIMAKQLFPMLGLTVPTDLLDDPTKPLATGAAPPGEPINALLALPASLLSIDTLIGTVGLTSLAILIAFPYLKARVKAIQAIPAQVVVLLVAVPLALALGVTALVRIPNVLPDVFSNYQVAFHLPDFRGLASFTGVKFIILFALIGSIESMLSAKAVDTLDPWKRKTDMNRDLLAVGLANTLAAAVGALPMISEIVRSKANIDNGARTKMANFCHGLFLLVFVLALPFVINLIPLAALGAMLVYTGFRLASPREFTAALKVGPEQLFVFVSTIVITLCTDLLVGVLSGIALKFLLHLWNGASVRGLFASDVTAVPDGDGKVTIQVRRAAVFSNWLGLHKAIVSGAESTQLVVVDLSATRLVDHSVMEKLHELETDFAARGKHLAVVGTDHHTPLGRHPLAARRKQLALT